MIARFMFFYKPGVTISQEEGRELLAEIHGSECVSHFSSRTFVGKAFRHGFYWPTALQDATELVRSCKACQFHAKQIHTPAEALQMIPPSWPFAVWGVDILGLFPRAVGGYRFLYVAIDKFTKWPEVTPVVNITKKNQQSHSSSPLCADLASQTASSRTTGPNSKADSSKSTVRTSASSYALRP